MDADVRQAILDLREYANRLAPGDAQEIRRLCKVLTDALKEGVGGDAPMGLKYYPEPVRPECGKSVKT